MPKIFCCGVAALLLAFGWVGEAAAQGIAGGEARPLITGAVDEARLVPLAGSTRPEANAANDRGAVADTTPVDHMLLLLRRPHAQEAALAALIAALHDPASPHYHQWLGAAEFGRRFGLNPADLAAITLWLGRHGFVVNAVYANATLIDFSGTAGQVRAAFHTQLHHLDSGGAAHIANFGDPQIPAALAPAVIGIASLNDFRPKPQFRPHTQYSLGQGAYAVVPADLATIYNIKPLLSAGITGAGQTIVVAENSDFYAAADWSTFRSTFGLSGYSSGSLTTVHPGGCADPGVNTDDGETELDAEWASAAAPGAAIVVAACADTGATPGMLTAIEKLLDGTSPPSIISLSFGECETQNTASLNAAFNSAFQQGVAEGASIFVSAGDAGAADCDQDLALATDGIGVSGYASTPYNVAVGGTDFADTYLKVNGTYWSGSNGSNFASALSYIPEIPWNDACASQLIASFNNVNSPVTYCNTAAGKQNPTNVVAGGGGPSACATGTPSPASSAVVSGTCKGWAKPSWQAGLLGVPNDGVRDLPDVALFAADGNAPWGHFYLFCFSDPDPSNNGAPCTQPPSGWAGGGGTSFAAPIMAGLQALVNQHAGGAQGNPNSVYYSLAQAEYGSGGSAACTSSQGKSVGGNCIFYNITLGDNDVGCASSPDHNCYAPGASVGVLSTSNSADQPAYKTATGWNFATGIGSVNAYNLVMSWPATQLTLSVSETGSGTVTSAPAGIDCGDGGACSAGFASGTQVTLTETANAGWSFTGWGGACSGTGGCTVTMNAAESVSATFAQAGFTVSVSTAGNGTVTSSPAGIDCGATCSAGFAAGTQVSLTPAPAARWGFAGWSGACSGTGGCTLSGAGSVGATFTHNQLSLTVARNGHGLVTSAPRGIHCGKRCSAEFDAERKVTLTATPTANSMFTGWSGGGCRGTGTCTVDLRTAKTVTANFSHNGS